LSRDEAHLLDILKAARLAIEFAGPGVRCDFVADVKSQSAAMHRLMVIGEPAKRLSPEFRQAHPQIPWKLIAGTRDKLIHFCEGVDLDEVWKMITADLPQLIRWIEPYSNPEPQ
jgi:uncharacterized protein with HEPN domain